MSAQALWYLSRATGLVAFVLLSFVAVLGLVISRRGRLPGLPRGAGVALHRNASLFAVVLLAVHVLTAVVDPYVSIGWLAAIVPFTSSYEPLWLGLGVLALDMVATVVVTSLLRFRLGLKRWRAVHWLAYAAWPIAAIHGIGAAADLQSGALLGVVIVTIMAVGATVVWRFGPSSAARPSTA
jgi:methionine sulfoxide reductase heme-binding subunit